MYDNSNSNVNSNNVTLIYKIRDYAACYWQALKMHAYMLQTHVFIHLLQVAGSLQLHYRYLWLSLTNQYLPVM